MPFTDFYMAAILGGQHHAVRLAESAGLSGSQITRLIQRTEKKRARGR